MNQLHRRQLLLAGALAPTLAAEDPNPAPVEPQEPLPFEGDEDLVWHDPLEWGLEGQGWREGLGAPFDRLPAKAEASVRPPVWRLSRMSSGLCAHFASDSEVVAVRYRLGEGNLAMPHMPATGVSGCCLYAREPGGTWRWVVTSRPERRVVRARIGGLRPGHREHRVYLPLFNRVEALQVGVLPEAAFKPLPPRSELPVVFYGTSILHGACASRPGMAFPSILGRRLARPVINLGFSGNGRMEPEVAELLAEVPAALYVVDCLPNMGAKLVAERAAPFVRLLRAARPETPILLTENRTWDHAHWRPSAYGAADAKRLELAKALAELRAEGLTGLHHLGGAGLLGSDGEATVDASHPTDLGMMRYADAYEPKLRAILG